MCLPRLLQKIYKINQLGRYLHHVGSRKKRKTYSLLPRFKLMATTKVSGYMLFCKETRDSLNSLTPTEKFKELGTRWKLMMCIAFRFFLF